MRIQSFADILICSEDWLIQAYSAPLVASAGGHALMQIGASLSESLGRQFAHDARGWGQAADISSQMSRTFGYQINKARFDIACLSASNTYCIVLEPSATGRPFAPDVLARRLLQRARRLASRRQAIDSAVRAVRLPLQADSVSLLRVVPGEFILLEGQDRTPSHDELPGLLPPALQAALSSGAGFVADSRDGGSSLAGIVDDDSGFLLSWLQMPSPSLISFLSERGSRSAHWYAGSATCGDQYYLFVEHSAPGAVDAAKRYATELALEVLLLIIDAEHPTVC